MRFWDPTKVGFTPNLRSFWSERFDGFCHQLDNIFLITFLTRIESVIYSIYFPNFAYFPDSLPGYFVITNED